MNEIAKCKWCGRQIRKTVVNPGMKAERVIWSHDFQAPAIQCIEEPHHAEPVAQPAAASECKETLLNADRVKESTGNLTQGVASEPRRRQQQIWDDPLRLIGAILDRIDMAPNDDPVPYIREYIEGLRQRAVKELR